MRPRANDRHVAQQYIHQLGELVDIRAPQNTVNAHHRARLQAHRRVCSSVERWRTSWPGVNTFPINMAAAAGAAGCSASSGWGPLGLPRRENSFGRKRFKSIPVGRVWVRFAKYNLLNMELHSYSSGGRPCTPHLVNENSRLRRNPRGRNAAFAKRWRRE